MHRKLDGHQYANSEKATTNVVTNWQTNSYNYTYKLKSFVFDSLFIILSGAWTLLDKNASLTGNVLEYESCISDNATTRASRREIWK